MKIWMGYNEYLEYQEERMNVIRNGQVSWDDLISDNERSVYTTMKEYFPELFGDDSSSSSGGEEVVYDRGSCITGRQCHN